MLGYHIADEVCRIQEKNESEGPIGNITGTQEGITELLISFPCIMTELEYTTEQVSKSSQNLHPAINMATRQIPSL